MPTNSALSKAKTAAQRYFARRDGVTGIGIGWDRRGVACLKVLLREDTAGEHPATFAGVPVIYEVTGKIEAGKIEKRAGQR